MSKIKPNSNHSSPAETPFTFEQSLAALEDSVRRLEDGELDLASALAAFENGIRHLKCCYTRLEEAERRIEILCGVDGGGQAHVRPLADHDLSLEEKQQARSRRRSHEAALDEAALDEAALDEPAVDNIDADGRLF